MQQKQELEAVKQKLHDAKVECQYIEKLLAQKSPEESRAWLHQLLKERGLDISDFISTTFEENPPENVDFMHASTIMRARSECNLKCEFY